MIIHYEVNDSIICRSFDYTKNFTKNLDEVTCQNCLRIFKLRYKEGFGICEKITDRLLLIKNMRSNGN